MRQWLAAMFTVKFKGCPQVAVSSQILRLRVDSGRARRFDAPFTPGLLRRSNSRAAAVTGRARTGKGRWRSRPISRVLSWTVIPLGATSPLRSSSLPGPDAGRVMRSLFGLAPGGVCRAGLLPGSRCALTAPFHPCLIPRHPAAAFPEGTWPMLRIVMSPCVGPHRGGEGHRRNLSVALSVGSRRPGVTWHRALWSPDFPRHRFR